MAASPSRTWSPFAVVAVLVFVVAVVAVVTLVRGTQGAPTTPAAPASGLTWVAESALDAQAKQTLAAIRTGGPFPYPRNDGVVFENREGHLPDQASGYYHEYTVVTPGSQDRGPRRIITGSSGERYYTVDHYDSFQRIREGT